MKTQRAEELYAEATVEYHTIEDATIALRKFGSGPALLFIHGYPVNGYTWRKLLPELSKRFTCYVIDLPGLGSSRWTAATDFTFTAQAKRIVLLLDQLAIQSLSVIAQDTGATIARMVALEKQDVVQKLVLFNTEIPGHRPPFIPLYQKLAQFPGSALLCNYALGVKGFLSSRFGFGQFYTNKELFDNPEYLTPYVERLKNSLENIKGALKYQDGIEWNVIDDLRLKHKLIKAKTLLLWGEDDNTFPVELAEEMNSQFEGNAIFKRLPGTSLMPQEEKPEASLEHILPFLS